jgi:hypothetical protein
VVAGDLKLPPTALLEGGMMALPWFRLYSDLLDNPKIQMLPEYMRYRYVALLCSRCKLEHLTDQIISFQWRVPPSDVQETKSLFMGLGIIDSDWNVAKWDKRQFVSDDVGARVKKHRANVTPMKRYIGVTCNPPDTDTEAEQTTTPMKRYF